MELSSVPQKKSHAPRSSFKYFKRIGRTIVSHRHTAIANYRIKLLSTVFLEYSLRPAYVFQYAPAWPTRGRLIND